MKNLPKLTPNFAIIACSFCLFFLACSDEPTCETPRQGAKLELSDSTKMYLSNYYGAKKIIFTNALGEEKPFVLRPILNNFGSYSYTDKCEYDTASLQTVQGESQLISYSLTSPELYKPIYIYIHEFPKIQGRAQYETLDIGLGELFSQAYKPGDGLFYHSISNRNQFSRIYDTYTILGKEFKDVITMENLTPTPNLELRYTKNEGIVYIRNPKNGAEYVYKRKE